MIWTLFLILWLEKLNNTQIFCSPPTPLPENNSWLKHKELNPDLTWREWNLHPQGLQGGTLCPGMDDESSSDMMQIREWLLDQEMSEPTLIDLRSEIINELSTRFFVETGFIQCLSILVPRGSASSADLVQTADAAFCHFHMTACRQANTYKGFVVSEALVKYFVTSEDEQVVKKLTSDIQSFSNPVLFELDEGMVFIVGNSKAHQAHETSLLMRKTQIQDDRKQKWTLTWIDPSGFSAYNKEGYTSWNSYRKHRQEFEDEVMALFGRIVESSVTASVEIEFCSLPVDNTSIARRAISEGGIQGLFESILDMETMELNQYRAIDWCVGLHSWIIHIMIATNNFNLMDISLAIGSLSRASARQLFLCWVQNAMVTHYERQYLSLAMYQLLWPDADARQSAAEKNFRNWMNSDMKDKEPFALIYKEREFWNTHLRSVGVAERRAHK